MSQDIPPTATGPVVRPAGDRPIRFRALPLRMVVAGRFGLAAGRLHRLDMSGAGGLLERTAPALALRVADLLRADGTELTVDLQFRHRRDFAPGAVARAVPDLARVMSAHAAIRSGTRARQDDLADFPALRDVLDATEQAPPPAEPSARTAPPAGPPETSGDDSIDRLLGMVDTGGPAPESGGGDLARSAVSGFISEVTRSSTRRQPAGSPPEALEDRLADQIAAVLSHPDYVALERAWGALRFLARRIDFRAQLTVEVLEADADSLADALEALVPEDDMDGAGPVRLVVDLNDYDASDRDMARLGRLAAFGASRRAVVLCNADPRFCGEAGPDVLTGMHDPETHFETAGYAGWRNLRDAADTGWLGLCLSRVVLRDAVDGRDDKTLRFARSRRIGRLLDVGAAPAAAALIAEAAAATRWACAVGAGSPAAVDNLTLAHNPQAGFDGPVRPAVTVSGAASLASAGLIALVPERGRDTARLMRMPSVRRLSGSSERDGDSLTGRLFQAQVVHGLQWNADRIFDSTDAGELRDRVESCLAAMLGDTGPGASVEVRLARDDDGDTVLAVHVRSGSSGAPGAGMAFDIPLGPGSDASGSEP